MTHRSIARVLWSLAIVVNPLWTASAHAGLGGDAASVLADGTELHGSVDAVAVSPLYDARLISTDTGLALREYLNRDGVVFAVAWSGPIVPDLQRLLGAHFAEYSAAVAALDHAGLRRSLRIASSSLVVESGGHLRAFAGRAYLPALVPAGVALPALR
jgi:hypothetical protein